MLAEVVALAHAGRLTRRGLPRDLRELARLARTYDREAHAPPHRRRRSAPPARAAGPVGADAALDGGERVLGLSADVAGDLGALAAGEDALPGVADQGAVDARAGRSP